MKLIPFVSTHLKVKDHFTLDCTFGEVYPIEEWIINEHGTAFYQFTDDVGDTCRWIWEEDECSIEDASFEENLKNILSD